jgi:signal transduction histidine kinase
LQAFWPQALYTQDMGASNVRFRVIVLVILAVSLIGVRSGQPPLHQWPAFALALIFAAGIFLMRSQAVKEIATAATYAVSLVAVYFYPQLVSALMVSIGVLGSRLPWRLLRWLAAPIVAVSVLAQVAGAYGGLGWAQIFSLSSLNMAVAFSAILMLGRMAADTSDARAAQAAAHLELQKAHEELKRHAAQAEELAALQERTRLSRELHDTLGHALSAITVQLEAVRRLSRVDHAKSQALLDEAQATAREAMQGLRAHLVRLRGEQSPENLRQALIELADATAARNGWQLHLDLADVSATDAQSWTLLQVAREALTNAERHAAAREVGVSLSQEGGELCLRVEDDGRGLGAPLPVEGHYGIVGMRERLREAGGNVEIAGGASGGTLVLARLPQGGLVRG